MLERKFLRTLTSKERKQHLRNADRINTAAFPELRRFLKLGYWTLIYPEATRVLVPGMKKVHDGVATALRHPDTNILPMALIGTDKMWRPGNWRPHPFSKVTVIFGEPISYEEGDRRAKRISKRYGVSEDRALCDLVMRRIARLMIDNGHPEYAGFYGKTRRERLGNGKGGDARKKENGEV
ncbi:MAG: lysophospholipid acyltransferase family protein [Candidatus Woykebacteria bacterium]